MRLTDNHATGYSLLSYLCGYYRHYYPEEFVAAYMICAANDDDINTGKAMAKKLGITITKPRFRQDNRAYYIDKEHHTISDALSSVKGIGIKDAEGILTLADHQYDYFVDLLRDMTMVTGSLNTSVVDKLIRLDYFREFGPISRLMKINEAFTSGEYKFAKTYCEATQSARMKALREFESSLPPQGNDDILAIRNEIELYGAPVTTCSAAKDTYAVLNVDTNYSPKITLYSVSRGTTGMMKVLKKDYNKNPMKVGDLIRLLDWKKKPSMTFSGGKPVAKPGAYELWIEKYDLLG